MESHVANGMISRRVSDFIRTSTVFLQKQGLCLEQDKSY